LDIRHARRVAVDDLQTPHSVGVDRDRLHVTVAQDGDRHLLDQVVAGIVGGGEMARLDPVIDVHNRKPVDCHGLVKGIDLPAAANTVARVVDEAVSVCVCDVLRDNREVADVDLKVRVGRVVAS
jgi:hypothetical protein